jgi:hypothetical protein
MPPVIADHRYESQRQGMPVSCTGSTTPGVATGRGSGHQDWMGSRRDETTGMEGGECGRSPGSITSHAGSGI